MPELPEDVIIRQDNLIVHFSSFTYCQDAIGSTKSQSLVSHLEMKTSTYM